MTSSKFANCTSDKCYQKVMKHSPNCTVSRITMLLCNWFCRDCQLTKCKLKEKLVRKDRIFSDSKHLLHINTPLLFIEACHFDIRYKMPCYYCHNATRQWRFVAKYQCSVPWFCLLQVAAAHATFLHSLPLQHHRMSTARRTSSPAPDSAHGNGKSSWRHNECAQIDE